MNDETAHKPAMAFGGLLFVFCGALMTALAAAWMHLRQHVAGGILIGMVAEALVAWAVLDAAYKWENRSGNRSWSLFLLGAGFCLKLPALWFMKTYVQIMDRGYFVSFVNRLAREGLSADSLGNLANSIYDFYSFFPRSFALALPLRLLVGEAALVRAHQGISLALALLSTWMVYRLLRYLLGDRTARLASGLYLLFPLRNVAFLDFAHQVPGEFTLLLGLTSVLGAMRAKTAIGKSLGAIGVAASLFLGHLLVGVDILIVGIGLGLLAFGWRSFSPQSRRRNAPWILCAMLLAGGLTAAFSSWQGRMAPSPLSSGQAGFMARGWSFRGWGEYDGWLEIVDREAAPAVKAPLMRAYVGSQIRFQPVRVFALLLPVKAVKYFLPGFASGSEQALEAGGHFAAAEFLTGARLFYAIFLLAAVVLGCFRSGGELESRRLAVCLFFPGLFCLAQILGGETSPRYAFYLHFMLLGVAARALDFRRKIAGGARWIGAGFAQVAIYAVWAGALAVALRACGAEHFLRDMRTVSLESPAKEWIPDAIDGDYFRRAAVQGENDLAIRLFVPDVPETHRQLHVFVSATPAMKLQFSCDGETWRDLRSPRSALIDLSRHAHRKDGGAEVVLRFRSAIPGGPIGGQIGVGYLFTGNFGA